MSNKTQIIEAMERGIAANLRAKAAGNVQVISLIDRVFAAAEELPESYYTDKLYPEPGKMSPGAFVAVWKELAAKVGREG